MRIAKLQSVEMTFEWCVTFVLPNSYVIKLHLKHIELFSNLSIELASNKKRIRWCRKIKLYHKQSKNKYRYHTHTRTHTHRLSLAPPTPTPTANANVLYTPARLSNVSGLSPATLWQ